MEHQGATAGNGSGLMTTALRRAWAKDLDAPTLYELLKLRVEVFVVEQACPYPELDGRDLLAETRHFWLEKPDGEVISTLRLMEEHAGEKRRSASAGSAPNATPAAKATPLGCCVLRWPRWATIRAGSTRRPT